MSGRVGSVPVHAARASIGASGAHSGVAARNSAIFNPLVAKNPAQSGVLAFCGGALFSGGTTSNRTSRPVVSNTTSAIAVVSIGGSHRATCPPPADPGPKNACAKSGFGLSLYQNVIAGASSFASASSALGFCRAPGGNLGIRR